MLCKIFSARLTLVWKPLPGQSEVFVHLPPPWCSKQSGLELKTSDPVPP